LILILVLVVLGAIIVIGSSNWVTILVYLLAIIFDILILLALPLHRLIRAVLPFLAIFAVLTPIEVIAFVFNVRVIVTQVLIAAERAQLSVRVRLLGSHFETLIIIFIQLF